MTCFKGFPRFYEGLVSGMTPIVSVESSQYGFNGTGFFDCAHDVAGHFTILVVNLIPTNRPGKNTFQIGELSLHSLVRQIKPFIFNAFKSRAQFHVQKSAKRKSHFALAVRVNEIGIYSHLGIMKDESPDHSGHLGGRRWLKLRINACGIFVHMPVRHDSCFLIMWIPFCNKVLIPRSYIFSIRGAGG